MVLRRSSASAWSSAKSIMNDHFNPYAGFPKPLANGASHSCRDLRSPSERQVPGNRPFKSLGQGCGSRESENILGPTHIQASARLCIRMAESETNAAEKPH